MSKQTTTVYLIRHGQTRSNVTGYLMGWTDEGLDDVGYTQANSLAARIASLPITSVYTSPLRRAFETAAIAAKPHGLEPRVYPDLVEINYGDWQGLHREQVRQEWPELWQKLRIYSPDVVIPNGESLEQVNRRTIRAFNTIITSEPGGQVAIVTHQGILKAMVAYILNAPNIVCSRFELGNASLSLVRITDGTPRLITLNDMSHIREIQ